MLDLARYYGTSVLPARPRAPRDKASVESSGRWSRLGAHAAAPSALRRRRASGRGQVLVNILLVAYPGDENVRTPLARDVARHATAVSTAPEGQRSLFRRTGSQLRQKAMDEQISGHGERYLLAFVYGTLSKQNLLGVKNEVEKYLLLAALNLVGCIAATAADAPLEDSTPR